MKIRRSIPIAGAATRPGDRSAGNWWRNGCGTSAWNWGISWSQLPCAPPSLLLPSRRRASRLPRVRLHQRPRLGMVRPPRPPPGKRGASRGKTFLSSPMAPSNVRLGSLFTPMSGVEKPMAACAWCMRPASAVAVPARCVSSVSGRAKPPRSRARSASCCIHWLSGMRHFSGVTGVVGPPTSLHPAPARSVRRGPGRASYFCQPGSRVCVPFPSRACPLSALLGRATGSQCTSRNFWTGDDPTVRCPRARCNLARIGNRLTLVRVAPGHFLSSDRPALPSETHLSFFSAGSPDLARGRCAQSKFSFSRPM